jgi:hypothetical protein
VPTYPDVLSYTVTFNTKGVTADRFTLDVLEGSKVPRPDNLYLKPGADTMTKPCTFRTASASR